MKIKEFIELLQKYPQHQDVMISCGNCNHGHIWFEGEPLIEDHTDQTYGYINIKILDDKSLGNTFVLHQEGLRVLEQDVKYRSQGKYQEEASEGMRKSEGDKFYSLGILKGYLSSFYHDNSIYRYMNIDKWTISFMETFKNEITNTGGGLYVRCREGIYKDIDEMMQEVLQEIKNNNSPLLHWAESTDDNMVEQIINRLAKQNERREVRTNEL